MDNIFITINEIKNQDQKENLTLNKLEVVKSIPSTATHNENKNLSNTHIEWRWRIFKIPDKHKEFIEISYKKPTENRMFINKSGEWVEHYVSTEYDKYVTEQYFDYSNENIN